MIDLEFDGDYFKKYGDTGKPDGRDGTAGCRDSPVGGNSMGRMDSPDSTWHRDACPGNDGGILMGEGVTPDEPDPSRTLPSGVTDPLGRKKVQVPDLVSATKLLFRWYKGPMYLYFCRCLRDGTLGELTGTKVLNKTINRHVCNFTNVRYYRIDREDFYADVEVEMTLTTAAGLKKWKGFLVCWCYFDPVLKVSFQELADHVDRPAEEYDYLDRYLVPFATNQQIDQITEGIWRRYLPEALTEPKKRSAKQLAEKMGLSVLHYPVYEHQGVEGIVFFKEGKLLVGEDRIEEDRDGQKKHAKAKEGRDEIIPANTIVINANKIGIWFWDFAIFHECYHYDQHYLFYCLQEMASNDCRQVPTIEVIAEEGKVKDELRLLENQADRGGMGLLLPETHTRRLIWEEYCKIKEYRNTGDRFEQVGRILHGELHVPEFRMRMRMIQLGNIGAKGALNRAGNKAIEPFAFNPDSWRENDRTFIISEAKVDALMEGNSDFRAMMDSGDYIYADGHVVRNTPEYVYWDPEREGHFLTEYGLRNADRCCLRFVLKYVQKGPGRYVFGRMYYDADYVKQCEFYLGDIINARQLSMPDARYEFEKGFPDNFKEAFESLMRKNNETQETMADKLGISRRSLREWLMDPEKKISADFIIRIAQMWKLPDFISSLLLESAGISLNRKNPRNRALEHVRTVMWDKGVEAADRFLKDNQMEPLKIQW